MKKFITLSFALLMFVLNSDAQRFGTTKGRDNTGRVLTYAVLAPAYSATVTVAPSNYQTIIKPATLTGACTINATETNSKYCDIIRFIFTSDATGRVVTFGTNFVSAGTLTLVASKQATATFIYDGANYVELSRAIQP